MRMSAHHSPYGGQSSRGMQSPSWTTVSDGQLQPGSQTARQATNGSSHVPSHPLHSEYSWPPMGHAMWSREMGKKLFDRQKVDNCIYQKICECNSEPQCCHCIVHLCACHSPGHSSTGMHLPSFTTVLLSQLQPGAQIEEQIGFGSWHVPSHPLHSLYVWPSIGHSAYAWSESYRENHYPNPEWQPEVSFARKREIVTVNNLRLVTLQKNLCLWTMLTRALIKRDAFSPVHNGVIHTTAAGFTD